MPNPCHLKSEQKIEGVQVEQAFIYAFCPLAITLFGCGDDTRSSGDDEALEPGGMAGGGGIGRR